MDTFDLDAHPSIFESNTSAVSVLEMTEITANEKIEDELKQSDLISPPFTKIKEVSQSIIPNSSSDCSYDFSTLSSAVEKLDGMARIRVLNKVSEHSLSCDTSDENCVFKNTEAVFLADSEEYSKHTEAAKAAVSWAEANTSPLPHHQELQIHEIVNSVDPCYPCERDGRSFSINSSNTNNISANWGINPCVAPSESQETDSGAVESPLKMRTSSEISVKDLEEANLKADLRDTRVEQDRHLRGGSLVDSPQIGLDLSCLDGLFDGLNVRVAQSTSETDKWSTVAKSVNGISNNQRVVNVVESLPNMQDPNGSSFDSNGCNVSSDAIKGVVDLTKSKKPSIFDVFCSMSLEAGDSRILDKLLPLLEMNNKDFDSASCGEVLYCYLMLHDLRGVDTILSMWEQCAYAAKKECCFNILEWLIRNEEPLMASIFIQKMHQMSLPVITTQTCDIVSLACKQSLLPNVMKYLFPALPNYDEALHRQKAPEVWFLSELIPIEPAELNRCIRLSSDVLELSLQHCVLKKDLPFLLQIDSLAHALEVAYTMQCYNYCIHLYAECGDFRCIYVFEEFCEKFDCSEENLIDFIEYASKSKFTPLVDKIVARKPFVEDFMNNGLLIACSKLYIDADEFEKCCNAYINCLEKAVPNNANTGALEEKWLPQTVFHTLLQYCLCNKPFEKSCDFFNTWDAMGLMSGRQSYKLILEAAVGYNEGGYAHALFDSMMSKGYVDFEACEWMIKLLANAGRFDECFALTVEMSARGSTVDIALFNEILAGAVARNDHTVVWECIGRIKALSVKINMETGHILTKLLQLHSSRHTVERVLGILDEVDICRDETLFNTVLDLCVKFKDVYRLMSILEKFKMSDIKPELQTYGMLIKALGGFGRIEDCQYLWQELTNERGMEPNEITYGCMFDALVNNNCVREAVDLFHHMKREGRISPNTIMYSTIIKGYAQAKRLDDALTFYNEMKQDGVPLNTVTYNSIVDACARVGAIDKAAELLENMVKDGIEPDLITFSTVIKGYCVHGQMDKSLQLLEAMKEKNINPDGILYNSLLDGCVKARQTDLCERLWEEMRSNGISPSNFTLTILIKMYGRMGALQKAFKLAEELPSSYKFDINAHVYTCLMSACITNRKYQMAYGVFCCMKRDGFQPDAKTYETMIYGCAKGGQFEQAVSLIEQAFGIEGDTPSSFKPLRSAIGYRLELRTYRFLICQMKSVMGYSKLCNLLIERLRQCGIGIIAESTEKSPSNKSESYSPNGFVSSPENHPKFMLQQTPQLFITDLSMQANHKSHGFSNSTSSACYPLNGSAQFFPPHSFQSNFNDTYVESYNQFYNHLNSNNELSFYHAPHNRKSAKRMVATPKMGTPHLSEKSYYSPHVSYDNAYSLQSNCANLLSCMPGNSVLHSQHNANNRRKMYFQETMSYINDPLGHTNNHIKKYPAVPTVVYPTYFGNRGFVSP